MKKIILCILLLMFFYYLGVDTVDNYVNASNFLNDDSYNSNETNIIYEERNLIYEEFLVEITNELNYQIDSIEFDNILYGSCENLCITSDDDYNILNFNIEYPLVMNQEIYIKVNTNNEFDTYQLNVELIEHYHNYTYMYENNDALNHKSYCICGEYSVEHHNYQDFETGYKCINCNFYTEGPIINYDNYDLIVDDVILVRKEEEYEN